MMIAATLAVGADEPVHLVAHDRRLRHHNDQGQKSSGAGDGFVWAGRSVRYRIHVSACISGHGIIITSATVNALPPSRAARKSEGGEPAAAMLLHMESNQRAGIVVKTAGNRSMDHGSQDCGLFE